VFDDPVTQAAFGHMAGINQQSVSETVISAMLDKKAMSEESGGPAPEGAENES
jgi:hypothetical protein